MYNIMYKYDLTKQNKNAQIWNDLNAVKSLRRHTN